MEKIKQITNTNYGITSKYDEEVGYLTNCWNELYDQVAPAEGARSTLRNSGSNSANNML